MKRYTPTQRSPLFVLALLAGLLAFRPAPSQAQKPELVVETGHSNGVSRVVLSPNGRLLASTGQDRTIVWDAATGEEIRTLRSGGSDVGAQDLAWTPDSRLLISAGLDGVRIWQPATGENLATLPGPDSPAAPPHPPGQDVGVYGTSFFCLAISRDGRSLAGGQAGGTILVWSLETRRLTRVLPAIAERDGVSGLAFSPDGRCLAAGYFGFHSPPTLWNIAAGKTLRTFTRPAGKLMLQCDALVFNTRGDRLAASDPLGTDLWDVQTGQIIKSLGDKSLSAAPLGPDEIVTHDGRQFTLWNMNTGEPIRSFGEGDGTLEGRADVSADGARLVCSNRSGSSLILWSVPDGKVQRRFQGQCGSIEQVMFSPDGKSLSFASYRHGVRRWELASGTETSLPESQAPHWNATWSHTGTAAVVTEQAGAATLRDTRTDKELAALGPGTGMAAPVFSRDDRWLALPRSSPNPLLPDQAAVTLYNGETGEQVHALRGVPLPLETDISPDDTLIACSGMNKVRVWEVASGQERYSIAGTAGVVQFSPDSRRLVTSGADGTVFLRKAATGEEILRLPSHSLVQAPAFSPDGRTLAGACADATIKLWESATGSLLGTLAGAAEARSLSFSADGLFLASGGGDGKTTLWDIRAGQAVASLIALGTTDWVVITPGGRFDASPGGMAQMHYVVGMEQIALRQLKDRYYEPGLLGKLLGYNKESLRDVRAFDHVNLYPAVKAPLIVPASGKLALTLINRGGGIGQVQIFVNGKELTADARGPKPNPSAKTATVTVDISHAPGLVPGKPNTVQVVTWNAEGYLSSRGAKLAYTPPSQAALAPPDLWVIVGGISDYAEPSLHLMFPAKDAADFAQALTLGAKPLFGGSKVHLTLLDSGGQPGAVAPSKDNLRKAFAAARQARPGDVLVVYLAGHGVALSGEHDLYCYLTQEATTGDPATLTHDTALRGQTTVSSEELTDWIKKIPALKQVMVLDTCAAGAAAALLTAKRDIPSDQIRAIERLKDRTGFYVLMGCAADSVSYETSQYRQGLLTYSLLEGMKGASLRDGQYIDVGGLFNFAVDEVPRLAKNIGGVQRPFVAAPEAASFDVGMLNETDQAAIPLATASALLLRPELVPVDEDLNLEALLIARLRPDPSFVNVLDFPGAIQPRGTYTVTGGQVQVTLKLRRDAQVLTTLQVSGSKDDLPGLVRRLAAAIDRAVSTP